MKKILWAIILTTVSFFSMLHAQNNVHVATNGSNANPGTLAEPFATIQHAVNNMNPGDTCYIHGGTYREEVDLSGVAGESGAPITLINYQDEEVILSGTLPITSNWTQHSGNIYKTTLSEDIWQLFVDGKMMTLARFPNALTFSDLMWDRHMARRMKDRGQSTNGHVVDDPTKGATTTLVGAGVSFNGCVGVFNFGNFSTSAGIVANHTAGTDHFDYSPPTVQYRQTHDYFFEGGVNDAELTMVDMAEEWAYDESTKTLYLWADKGIDPTGRTIEGKNQTYFFTGNPATKNITIDGLDFFGTAFYFYSSDHITIKNCDLNYYSYSKRALGSTSPSDPAFFEGTTTDFCYQITVHNCEFNYSSGTGLRGEKVDIGIVTNNLFYQNSYACVSDGSVPSPSTVTLLRCRDMLFRRNTMNTSGSGQTVKLGERDDRPWVSEYNYFTGCGLQQTDGAAHYSYEAAATESVARYNWFYGNSARDFRWDGPNDPVVKGVRANIYRTVAMDTGRKEGKIDGDGYRLKGDFHEIYNNLGIGDMSTMNVALDKGGNANTLTRNNAADNFTDDPIPGTASHNFIGQYEPKNLIQLLRDPYNFDFRPRADAVELIDQGTPVTCSVNGQTIDVTDGFLGIAPDIGAYEYGDTVYWIPGRQSIRASFPIPADGANSIPNYSDLMFLYGYMSEQADIYLGKDYAEVSNADKTSPTYLTTKTISNIVSGLDLDANTTYYWRVDAIAEDGSITIGDTWSFTTGKQSYYSVQFRVFSSRDGIIIPAAYATAKIDGSSFPADSLGKTTGIFLFSGAYDYQIHKEGFISKSASIDIVSDTIITDTIESTTYQVTLMVRDEVTGESISGAAVVLGDTHAETDSSGSVSMTGIEYSFYQLSASAADYDPKLAYEVEIYSDTTLVISLVHNYFKTYINLVDRTTGDPVNRAVISSDIETMVSNSSGEVTMEKLLPGWWKYSVAHDDYFSLTDSVLVSSDTIMLIMLTNRQASIVFLVSDENGPVSEVPVTVNDWSIHSNSEGEVLFHNFLAREEYAYSIDYDGYRSVNDSFFLEVDTVISISLVPLAVAPGKRHAVSVYPNPAAGAMYVELSEDQAEIRLLGLDGMSILVQQVYYGVNRIDLSDIKPGMYCLQFVSEQVSRVYRIVIS